MTAQLAAIAVNPEIGLKVLPLVAPAFLIAPFSFNSPTHYEDHETESLARETEKRFATFAEIPTIKEKLILKIKKIFRGNKV